MNITLRQLRAFLAGTKSASFSEAAEKSFLTQPGYSLLIRQLEAELGVKLFDRTTRRVAVTKNGAELSTKLEPILQALEDALQDAHHTAARRRGRVTIGLMPSVASAVLADVVARMRTSAPDVVLRIKEELSGPLVDLVANGAVDLAIGVDFSFHEAVKFTPLMQDRIVGLFHPDEPLLREPEIQWSQLSTLPYIAFAQSSVEQCVSSAFAAAGAHAQPVFEVKFVATAAALVRKGQMFTALPELGLNVVDLDGLVVRPITPVASRTVGILVNAQRSIEPAAETTISAIKEAFAQLKR